LKYFNEETIDYAFVIIKKEQIVTRGGPEQLVFCFVCFRLKVWNLALDLIKQVTTLQTLKG
jgi:hypothetical protein